jgi:IS5 family transposase
MLPVYQYAEGLMDIQTLEALPNRMGMKYALHLPLSYLRITAQALCEFRQWLPMDGERKESFQRLLEQLTEFRLMNMQDAVTSDTLQVIEGICAGNRMERVFEAMYRVLVILTLTSPDWLRQLTLSHWYQRCSGKTAKQLWPEPEEGWKAMLVQTAIDIEYLLGVQEIILLEEVQELRKVLNEQFEISLNEQTCTRDVHWRQVPHPSCCWS